MNVRVVLGLLAKNLLSASLIFLLPLAMALYYGEDIIPFMGGLVAFLAIGKILSHVGKPPEYALNTRESTATTALFWIAACLLSSIPFLLSGYLTPIDSLMESVSGLTGTGLTVIPRIEGLPKSLLFFRSLTHWFGGLGIIVIFVALFPQGGSSTNRMFRTEVSGPTIAKTLPRIKDIAKGLFTVYSFFTVLLIVILAILGMPIYDALNQGLSCIATGGFSTWDNSIGHVESQGIRFVIILFMLLSSINYELYLTAWHKGFKVLYRDTEVRTFLGLVAGATILITINLAYSSGMPVIDAFRNALFQSSSAASTTGFAVTDYVLWPDFSQFILLLLILIGGCGGSTSGGLKVMRLMILFKTIVLMLHQQLHPRAVLHFSNNNRNIHANVRNRVSSFFFFYMLLIAITAGCLMFSGLDFRSSIGAAFAAMSNEGTAFGLLGPSATYAGLPFFSKAVLCVSMLLGRLEIITLALIFIPSFWRKNGW